MIDFLKYRYMCLVFSVVFLIAGVVGYIVRGGFRYHIDFVGGTEINVRFKNSLNILDFRNKLSGLGWKDLTIQSIGSADNNGMYKEFSVRVGDTGEDLESRFKKDVDSVLKDNEIEIRGVASVGSEVGADIRWRTFLAIIISLFVVLLYIALMRSGYKYAIGAVVALLHDLLSILVIFVIFEWQISVSVLAAILAIFGYSLNDTIVIFSRIRENFSKFKGMSDYEIVNLSINQTLRRTLLTSFTTFLSMGSLLILGGESLRGFALAMIIGIVFGTYSSIYIASPIMMALGSSKRN